MSPLYHWSPKRNRESILRHGLIAFYAQSVPRYVWLCVKGRVQELRGYIALRHSTADLDLWSVHLPHRWLTRRASGLWVTCLDCPIHRIRRLERSSVL
jgi:hypothetical protein